MMRTTVSRRVGSRSGLAFVAVAMAAGLMLVTPSVAQANTGWGSWGSSGGYGSSGGSWGCSGGVYYGRRPVRNLLGRIGYRIGNLGHRLHHHGSSGGWGCSGGYYYASSGGSSGGTWAYGSGGTVLSTRYFLDQPMVYARPVYTGSHYQIDCTPMPANGSINSMLEPGTEGMQYYQPQNATPVEDAAPTPADTAPTGQPMPNPGPAGDDDVTQAPADDASSAILSLEVPEEARVFINGELTSTPGRLRRYRSRNLSADQDYHYQVRAELERDGQRLVRTQLVSMRGGTSQELRLDFDAPPITTLALEVPQDATVTLCGQTTEQTGEQRQFTTAQLADGQICPDYEIAVTYQVDGREVRDVRSIELTAGQRVSLKFGPQVADDQQIAAVQ